MQCSIFDPAFDAFEATMLEIFKQFNFCVKYNYKTSDGSLTKQKMINSFQPTSLSSSLSGPPMVSVVNLFF